MTREQMVELRERIVLAGKASDKFRRLAKQLDPDHRKTKKYWDTEDTVKSGATDVVDWEILQSLIDKRKPEVIVELGTWFGTSAYAMSEMACRHVLHPIIHTCDFHDVFLADPKYAGHVRFYNYRSTNMLTELVAHGVKCDFAFVDARMKKGDARFLCSLFRGKILIAFHDYNTKGGDNIARVRKVRPDLRLVKPKALNPDSCIAVLEEV
jgi:hypothetical protein